MPATGRTIDTDETRRMSGSSDAAAAGIPSERPTGTVTFLFTDIEGSTARWERHHDAMRGALRRHDAIVRTAIVTHGGHVFKTVGDAFCAAFARPEDAVEAALALQIALHDDDFTDVDGIRVRVAIHTGTTDERDRDFFGPVVNRVARLLAAAHGGQILVSGGTTACVAARLPVGTSLRDLGEHRLKDLATPERVFQMVAPDLDHRFGPLRSISTSPNNLPVRLTPLLGREREVIELVALLQTHRLVTIVGSGGVGKTRTSQQVGADAIGSAPDGVWFVELAPVAEGTYLPAAIARAARVTPAGDDVEALVAALAPLRALLVFDNCEHLLDDVARITARVLDGCPHVRILASSRERIGISGEVAYRMPSLAMPDSHCDADAATAMRSPAVALFVERAAAVDRSFTLTDDNAGAVVDICRRLDGIPLAIELAAARITILRPRQLRDRLDERFRLLVGGNRDALPRQRTLRALIDWSYDLLDDGERTLFRRLCVFVNGFTLEGAVAVGDANGATAPELLATLASLVEKSLVLATDADGASDAGRYRMLESTRAYGLEKLAAVDELARSYARHLTYVRDVFVEERRWWERSTSSARIIARLVVELEDVRAALDRINDDDEERLAIGARLLAAIDTRWERVGLGREASRRLERFFGRLPPGESRLAAYLLDVDAHLASARNELATALERSHRAVALARVDNDAHVLATVLPTLAGSLARDGSYAEATRLLAEAEALDRPEDRLLRFRFLDMSAYVASCGGNLDAAASAYERLRDMQLEAGNVEVATSIALGLAEVEHKRGGTARAAAIANAALPTLRAGRDRDLLFHAQTNLCGYLLALDRTADATMHLRDALGRRDAYEAGDVLATVSIEHAALLFALRGDRSRAAYLAAYADAAFERLGYEREFTERTTHERLERLIGDGRDADALAHDRRSGASANANDAVTFVLASLE